MDAIDKLREHVIELSEHTLKFMRATGNCLDDLEARIVVLENQINRACEKEEDNAPSDDS